MKKTLTVCSRWKCVATTFAMAFILTIVPVRAGGVQEVDVKIARVALFKNGLGYFTSSATLPNGATTIKLGPLPIPSHGTFWVDYPNEVKVRALFTSMDRIEETNPVRSIAELLRVNPGRKVTVTTGLKDMPETKGTIVNFIQRNSPTEPIGLYPPSPYFMDIRRSSIANRYNVYRPITTPQLSPLVIIRTETGTVALNAESIIRADFEDEDITTTVRIPAKKPSIRMELAEESRGEQIRISYLARGITWSPSYRIDISDPKTARMSAKAIVINEVVDMHDVQLELVTGFPNLQFGEVSSPMAMSQNLADFMNSLTNRGSQSRGRGHMLQQQAMLSNTARFGEHTSVPEAGYSTAREGTVSEDLFLYPVENCTLPRGETAYIPLFTAEVPYKHIYTWNIPDRHKEDWPSSSRRGSDEQLFAEEVWHSCRLVNNMKMPWTTAATKFVKDDQITGQDVCYYTAPGAKTTIRINRAMNVQAEKFELELSRKRNAAKFRGLHYDLVRVKGTLSLQNRQNKSVNVEVTKNLSGNVLVTVPQAVDIPTANELGRVNPRHALVWEIELKPGEKKTLSYEYEVYIVG